MDRLFFFDLFLHVLFFSFTPFFSCLVSFSLFFCGFFSCFLHVEKAVVHIPPAKMGVPDTEEIHLMPAARPAVAERATWKGTNGRAGAFSRGKSHGLFQPSWKKEFVCFFLFKLFYV